MSEHNSVYTGLVDTGVDNKWAFGSSFEDTLIDVETALPDGVDRFDLAVYCLMLADDALILAQRLAEWCTQAPELEQELALANIGLDLLGQARLLLARAAVADPAIVPVLPHGSPIPAEDALAFFRDEPLFRCVRLVELANGDFAHSITRLLLFATFRLALMCQLSECSDPVLAAAAAKAVKEVTYHRDYAARWFITLACGTDESRRRLEEAAIAVWPYVDELFSPNSVEQRLAATNAAVVSSTPRAEFDNVLDQVLQSAGMARPDVTNATLVEGRSGRDGVHTSALSYLLADMQSVARAHPTGRW
jgi:ring-1,2-phenylacetyl-CoA epoxidase subunit PaaC